MLVELSIYPKLELSITVCALAPASSNAREAVTFITLVS